MEKFICRRNAIVLFIRYCGFFVFVSPMKSSVGSPKIICLSFENAGQLLIMWIAVSSVSCRLAQALQLVVVAVFSVYDLLLSSLWPVRNLVSILSVRFGWFSSISRVFLESLRRLNNGAQSSLIPLFCQFEFSFVFLSSMCLRIICLRDE